MADNPFYITPANPLQALLLGVQGYDKSRSIVKEDAMAKARASAQQALEGNGNIRGALAQLIGAGDTTGANVLAQYHNNAAAQNTVYGTPIYGTTKDGKTGIGTFDKTGTFRLIDTGGFTPTPGGIKPLDTGAGFVPFNPRTGSVGGGPMYQPGNTATQTPGFIPKTGEVPIGYAPQVGSQGITAAPIPGTPQAQKVREDQLSAVAKDEQTMEGAALVKQYIQDARKLVKSAPWYNPAVGLGTVITENVRGSNAANLQQITETIRGNIGFDRLQRMRDESPTGGALGQVAIQELSALQASLGSLANSQSKDQFERNLNRVEALYDRIARKAAAYPNAAKYGFAPPQRQAAPTAPAQAQPAPQIQRGTTAINPQTGERIMFDGSRWVPAQ